jgi:hypothetical protein
LKGEKVDVDLSQLRRGGSGGPSEGRGGDRPRGRGEGGERGRNRGGESKGEEKSEN